MSSLRRRFFLLLFFSLSLLSRYSGTRKCFVSTNRPVLWTVVEIQVTRAHSATTTVSLVFFALFLFSFHCRNFRFITICILSLFFFSSFFQFSVYFSLSLLCVDMLVFDGVLVILWRRRRRRKPTDLQFIRVCRGIFLSFVSVCSFVSCACAYAHFVRYSRSCIHRRKDETNIIFHSVRNAFRAFFPCQTHKNSMRAFSATTSWRLFCQRHSHTQSTKIDRMKFRVELKLNSKRDSIKNDSLLNWTRQMQMELLHMPNKATTTDYSICLLSRNRIRWTK